MLIFLVVVLGSLLAILFNQHPDYFSFKTLINGLCVVRPLLFQNRLVIIGIFSYLCKKAVFVVFPIVVTILRYGLVKIEKWMIWVVSKTLHRLPDLYYLKCGRLNMIQHTRASVNWVVLIQQRFAKFMVHFPMRKYYFAN